MKKINLIILIILFSFLIIGCKKEKKNKIDEKEQEQQQIIEELIYVEFYDIDGFMISSYSVKSMDDIVYPNAPNVEYYEFKEWIKLDTSTEKDIKYQCQYELNVFDYNVSFEILGKDVNYSSKEEMVRNFLKDFYDFVKPQESYAVFLYGYDWDNIDIKNGTWSSYLGGSQSINKENNKLIKDNDLTLKDEEYFFNSDYYGGKWNILASYVRNKICKSNKRFGYSDVEYNYGALDFYRYIVNDPSTYISSYGGEDVFYGYPRCETYINETVCHYGEYRKLPYIYNPDFEGWYLDEEYKDGPYITCEFIGDKVIYAKWKDSENKIYLMDKDDKGNEITLNVLNVSQNKNIVLPNQEKNNCEFIGWYFEGSKLDNNYVYPFDCDIKIYAKWNNFDKNDLIYLEYDGKTVYYNGYNPVELYEEYVEKEEGSEELRATWVSDFVGGFTPSSDEETMKKNLTEVLNEWERMNINCVFFHLRTHNNALYKTKLAPIKAVYGTYETFEEFDYVPWLIEECHKRGIEFHAWLNPYRIELSKYGVDVTPSDVAIAYKDYPENPASNPNNILITYYDATSRGAILNPAKEEVQDYIVKVVEELMDLYDIDGIHFDDYFYARQNGTPDIFDDPDQVDFLEYAKTLDRIIDVNSKEEKENWRRKNINILIYKLHNSISEYNKKYNKTIQFGIAPTAAYKKGDGSIESGAKILNSGHYGAHLYCDTYYWAKQGWIDYIMPQLYMGFISTNGFATLADWWNRALEGYDCKLYFGIGISHINTDEGSWIYPEELFNQLKYIQTLENVKGVSLFSSTFIAKYIDDDTTSQYYVYKKLMDEYWTKKMNVPQ